MSLYTPTGLKIRFDPEALAPVVAPLQAAGVWEDLLVDVSLWIAMPASLSTLACVVTAYLTHSPMTTLVATVAAYLLGEVVVQAGHGDRFSKLVAVMGNWLLILVAAGFFVIQVAREGQTSLAVTFGLIFLANGLGLTLLVLAPLTFLLEWWGSRPTGMASSDRLFLILCDERSARLGLELDWDLYEEGMRQKWEARLRRLQRNAPPAPAAEGAPSD